MVVCSCNRITDREIHSAVERLLATAQAGVRLTPGKVYGALDKRPCCGSCLPHAREIIEGRTARPSHCTGRCGVGACRCCGDASRCMGLAIAAAE